MPKTENKKGEVALRRHLLRQFRGSRIRPTVIRPVRDCDFAMEMRVSGGPRVLDQMTSLAKSLKRFSDFRAIVTFQGSVVDDVSLVFQIHVQWLGVPDAS